MNQTGIKLIIFMIFILLVVKKMFIKRYMIFFQYGSDPVLIQWVLIGFEAILEKILPLIGP